MSVGTASRPVHAPAEVAVRAPRSQDVKVFEPRQAGMLHALRELWEYRRFTWYFGSTLLRKRYTRTWLGIVWLPLKPGFSVFTKILIFGGLVGISAGNIPYALFFLVATAIWQLFSEAAYWSTRSLEINKSTLQAIHIPRLSVILSAGIPALADFFIHVGIAAVIGVYYWVRGGFPLQLQARGLLLVPAGLLLTMLLGIGIGLLTARKSVRARDVRWTLAYTLGFLYFMTPVIYPLSQVPNKWRPLAELNPLTGAIEFVKDGLFASHSLSPETAIVTVVGVLLVWIPGIWLFHRGEIAIHRAE